SARVRQSPSHRRGLHCFPTRLSSDLGLVLAENPEFDPIRKPFPKFREMTEEEPAELAAGDPAFGRIVCRCEMITEGEILAAIRRSEEHTSELQSRFELVCRLLLEKKE